LVLIVLQVQSFSSTQSSSNIPTDFIGKHRRSLRSIANRQKQNNELSIVQCNIVSQDFMKNLEEVLSARELVQIKFNVEKKTAAKELGKKMAEDTNSLLAQVVGHTALLYRETNPPGDISKMLREMVQP